MWLVIVIVLSVVLGILALAGLVAVAKELFCENSLDANFTDAGDATDRHGAGCAQGRRRVITP